MKKVKWRWDMGVYVPFCPYCDELAYETDHCVFCNKRYKWVDGKYKSLVVEHEGYTAVQATNNHITVCDADGHMVMHSSCNVKKTEDELREHIMFVKSIRDKNT